MIKESISRRELLLRTKQFAKDSASLPIAIWASLPAIAPMVLATVISVFSNTAKLIGKDFDLSNNDPEDKKSKKIPKIYKSYNMLNWATYTNLWTTHTREAFLEQRECIISSIDNSDIVLLEYGSKWEYFDNIANYAREKWKEIYNIDPMNFLEFSLLCIISWYNAIDWINQIINHRNLQQISTIWDWIRRSILWWIIWAFFNALPLYPMITGIKNKKYIINDISYLSDWRTVWMLTNILNIIKNNPWKKIISITWSWHAEWFEEYLNNHNNLYDTKRKLYNILYLQFFKNPKKID